MSHLQIAIRAVHRGRVSQNMRSLYDRRMTPAMQRQYGWSSPLNWALPKSWKNARYYAKLMPSAYDLYDVSAAALTNPLHARTDYLERHHVREGERKADKAENRALMERIKKETKELADRRRKQKNEAWKLMHEGRELDIAAEQKIQQTIRENMELLKQAQAQIRTLPPQIRNEASRRIKQGENVFTVRDSYFGPAN